MWWRSFCMKHITFVNATNLCQQVITRSRICNGKIEKAALDFFVVCFKILPFILKMTIDDHKRLTRFLKNKAVESDHSPIQLYLNMKQSEKCSTRVEIFNFKDPLSLAAFKDETSKSSKLSDCFKSTENLSQRMKRWRKRFDSSISKSFKKIRLGGRIKENEINKLICKRTKIKGSLKNSKVNEEVEKL